MSGPTPIAPSPLFAAPSQPVAGEPAKTAGADGPTAAVTDTDVWSAAAGGVDIRGGTPAGRPDPGLAAGAAGANPVQTYVAAVEAMLANEDRDLSSRLDLDELLALVTRAAHAYARVRERQPEEHARALTDRLAREVRALRDAYSSSERLTALSLDTLAIVLEYAPWAGAGFPAGPGEGVANGQPARLARAEALETYLVLAGDGLRARGRRCGAWTVPVISGSIPKGAGDGGALSIQSMAARLDSLLAAIAPGSRAVYAYSEGEARALVEAASRDGRPAMVTGHSMGGVNAINIANDNDNVALIVPIDPHHVAESMILFGLFKPPRFVREGVEVLSFYQRATPLQGNKDVRREEGGGESTPVLNEEVMGRTESGAGVGHMTIVDILYERGFLQMAMVRAMVRRSTP